MEQINLPIHKQEGIGGDIRKLEAQLGRRSTRLEKLQLLVNECKNYDPEQLAEAIGNITNIVVLLNKSETYTQALELFTEIKAIELPNLTDLEAIKNLDNAITILKVGPQGLNTKVKSDLLQVSTN